MENQIRCLYFKKEFTVAKVRDGNSAIIRRRREDEVVVLSRSKVKVRAFVRKGNHDAEGARGIWHLMLDISTATLFWGLLLEGSIEHLVLFELPVLIYD